MSPMRIARRCTKCAWTGHGDPAADCADHGRPATFTDYNRPYMGQPTPQAPSFNRKAYERGVEARAKAMAPVSLNKPKVPM